MPDVSFVNQTPSIATHYWCMWKMVRTAIDAGWTIQACGDGTNVSTAGPITPGSGTDYWNTIPSVSGAWLCMRHPTLAFEMIFWRNTTSNQEGRVIVAINNGFTAAGFVGATAASPGTIPAAGQYVMGSSSTWGYFLGNNGSNIPTKVNIIAKSDGSFHVWAPLASQTYGGFFGFSMTDPFADETADPWNFVFLSSYGTTQALTLNGAPLWINIDAVWQGIASDGILRSYDIREMFGITLNGEDLLNDGTTYITHKFCVSVAIGLVDFYERKGTPRMWRAVSTGRANGDIYYQGGVPAWVQVSGVDNLALRWDDATVTYMAS